MARSIGSRSGALLGRFALRRDCHDNDGTRRMGPLGVLPAGAPLQTEPAAQVQHLGVGHDVAFPVASGAFAAGTWLAGLGLMDSFVFPTYLWMFA